MGRIRQEIPKGNFVFKNKANTKGKRILYLRYYVNGIPVMTSTGISVRESEWDSRRESVKSINPASERLNKRLREKREEIDKQIGLYPGHLTIGILRDMMNGRYRNKEERSQPQYADFIEYAFHYNQQSYDFGKIAFSTYNNDVYNIELFRSFVADETGEIVVPFKELTVTLFDRYKMHCLKRGNKKSSINKKLKPLFKAIDYAAKSGVIPGKQAYNICEDGYYELRERQYDPEVKESVRYLTQEQIDEFIRLYPLMRHDRTREYMDMFLFAFYAYGLRFSDMLTLEWKHIDWEERVIRKMIYKEKERYVAPLNENAIKILKRWKAKGYNNRFVFNLLPENFDLGNAMLLDTQRKSKNRSLQLSLQEVGHEFSERLPFNLSFHVARHSFAVYALRKGVPTHELSKLMGHKSLAATEKFYAKYLPQEFISEEDRAKLEKIFTLPK